VTGNSRSIYVLLGLLAIVAVSLANPLPEGSHSKSASSAAPSLVHTCLITNNVDELVQFYESILTLKAEKSGKDYAEFRTGIGVLAIFSATAQEKYVPGAAEAGRKGAWSWNSTSRTSTMSTPDSKVS
jgi:hypothetical protein